MYFRGIPSKPVVKADLGLLTGIEATHPLNLVDTVHIFTMRKNYVWSYSKVPKVFSNEIPHRTTNRGVAVGENLGGHI